MRCPGNGMLMIAKVVTVPVSGSSTNWSSSLPVAGSASAEGNTLSVVASACAQQRALLQRAQVDAFGAGSAVFNRNTRRHGNHRDWVAVVVEAGDRFRTFPNDEIGDVCDRPHRLIDPVGVHAVTCLDRSVDCVQ